MTALADEISERRTLRPTCDSPIHLAVTDRTPEGIAQLVLDSELVRTSSGCRDLVEETMATVAIRMAVPQNLNSLSVDKVVSFRRRHRDGVEAFQTGIQELLDDHGWPELFSSGDQGALESHLLGLYKERVQSGVEDVQEGLADLSIPTVLGVFVWTLPRSAWLTQFLPINPTSARCVNVAHACVSAIQHIRRARRSVRRLMTRMPLAAYLVQAGEELAPTGLVDRSLTKARRFTFGI
jgi:hypothetical protein